MSFHVPERYRLTLPAEAGRYATDPTYGNNGVFEFNFGGGTIHAVASDGEGWEHVSVSLRHRVPNWAEMCKIKDLFWDVEDCVMQLHPPRSAYVNHHPFTLHLWRPNHGQEIPLPPYALIGPKKGQTQAEAEREWKEARG